MIFYKTCIKQSTCFEGSQAKSPRFDCIKNVNFIRSIKFWKIRNLDLKLVLMKRKIRYSDYGFIEKNFENHSVLLLYNLFLSIVIYEILRLV